MKCMCEPVLTWIKHSWSLLTSHRRLKMCFNSCVFVFQSVCTDVGVVRLSRSRVSQFWAAGRQHVWIHEAESLPAVSHQSGQTHGLSDLPRRQLWAHGRLSCSVWRWTAWVSSRVVIISFVLQFYTTTSWHTQTSNLRTSCLWTLNTRWHITHGRWDVTHWPSPFQCSRSSCFSCFYLMYNEVLIMVV